VPPCDGSGTGQRPLLSKDGKRITTFVRGTVVVRNLDDCGDILDTGLPGAKADFSWDGRHIAFHAPKPEGGGYEILVVDWVERTVRTAVSLPGSSLSPSWTQDGRPDLPPLRRRLQRLPHRQRRSGCARAASVRAADTGRGSFVERRLPRDACGRDLLNPDPAANLARSRENMKVVHAFKAKLLPERVFLCETVEYTGSQSRHGYERSRIVLDGPDKPELVAGSDPDSTLVRYFYVRWDRETGRPLFEANCTLPRRAESQTFATSRLGAIGPGGRTSDGGDAAASSVSLSAGGGWGDTITCSGQGGDVWLCDQTYCIEQPPNETELGSIATTPGDMPQGGGGATEWECENDCAIYWTSEDGYWYVCPWLGEEECDPWEDDCCCDEYGYDCEWPEFWGGECPDLGGGGGGCDANGAAGADGLQGCSHQCPSAVLQIIAEYDSFSVSTPHPVCADFKSSGDTTHFDWSRMNGGFQQGNPHNPWGWVTQELKAGLVNTYSNYNRGDIWLESGYRCPHGNDTVGGDAQSTHMRGRSADMWSLQHAWTHSEWVLLRDAALAPPANAASFEPWAQDSSHLHVTY
jgi:hypothetical protein